MSPNSTSSHLTQGIDPSAPGTIIREAIAIESLVVVGAGAYLLFFPKHFLLQTMGTSVSQATTTALQLTQHFGVMNILAASTAALCVPNTKLGVGARKVVYRVLLGFECTVVPLLVWQAFAAEGNEGLGRKQLLAVAAQFLPFMAWRAYTLGWKGEWFGRWLEGNGANGGKRDW